MTNECSITIAVPVYNIAEYLEKCIDSILNQTVSADEILLIDDGSTDGSSEICDRYAAEYANILVLHKDNEGLGITRNRALAVASGTHIVFVDGDDWVYPTMLGSLKTAYQIHGCDAVLCGYDEVDEYGKTLASYGYRDSIFRGEAIRSIFLPKMMGSSPRFQDSVCVGSKHVLYSMEIIRKNNIEFPSEREIISEDMFFNLKYYLSANSVALIPGYFYAYVQRKGSLTKSFRIDRFDKIKKFHRLMQEEMIQAEIWDDCRVRFSKTFFINLRMCVAQEAYCDDGLGLVRLKAMCEDELVYQILNEYPIEKLGIKQRFFIRCVRKKWVTLLKLFARLGILQ